MSMGGNARKKHTNYEGTEISKGSLVVRAFDSFSELQNGIVSVYHEYRGVVRTEYRPTVEKFIAVGTLGVSSNRSSALHCAQNHTLRLYDRIHCISS